MTSRVGFVVIGRNEGDRLARCLSSLDAALAPVVYVDSGSSDGSVDLARSLGIATVELDPSRPFTAARGRNAGFKELCRLAPGIPYVQFLDGDSELCAGWIAEAAAFLDANPRVAAVAGRLRERHLESSVYNLLCDIEWDRPAGEAVACGGNVMLRSEALAQVDGFRDDLIAGEEPELCVRLRAAGWSVWRLARDMAFHDADITRFTQWWRRSYRTGHAFAEGAYLHGAQRDRHYVAETRRAWVWGLGLPLLGLAAFVAIGEPGLLVFVLYPLQVARLAWRGERARRENWWHALFLVLGKFPEALGQMRFLANRLLGMRSRMIEYK